MKQCSAAVMLVLLVGCGTASRVVRLDTGQTDTIVFTLVQALNRTTFKVMWRVLP
ncbi:hypothetical protein ACN28S_37535 [Cystobacter fuscus]